MASTRTNPATGERPQLIANHLEALLHRLCEGTCLVKLFTFFPHLRMNANVSP